MYFRLAGMVLQSESAAESHLERRAGTMASPLLTAITLEDPAHRSKELNFRRIGLAKGLTGSARGWHLASTRRTHQPMVTQAMLQPLSADPTKNALLEWYRKALSTT